MSESPQRHILVLGGVARSLVNFRGPLIREMVKRGYKVTAASGERNEEVARTLAEWGVTYKPVPLGRAGLNPLADLMTLQALYQLMRRLKPDVVLAYTIKPVVYGMLAARMAGVPRRVAMITGLGYAFTEGKELKRRVARLVAMNAYRVSLRFAERVVFQNPDDRRLFVDVGLVQKEKAAEVAGSGVDLEHYKPMPLPDGPITFLMISRLLVDKGVREFAEAAKIVKNTQTDARFVLVGTLDANPTAIRAGEMEAWQNAGLIDWRGTVGDVRPLLSGCHVYVLPSYREGMPRTVLEAMASGRAIVTTDEPGCRETVDPGRNGLLVPSRDPAELAQALLYLAQDRDFVATAGEASLVLARARFDVSRINEALVALVEDAQPGKE